MTEDMQKIPAPNPDELLFACAVINKGNEVVIVRPVSAGERAKWAFPAGRVMPGESPEAACRRVVRENLAAEMEIEVGQPPLQGQIGNRKVFYRYFFGHVLGGEVGNQGFAEVRWVQLGQLRDYEFDPTTQMVVEWLLKEPKG